LAFLRFDQAGQATFLIIQQWKNIALDANYRYTTVHVLKELGFQNDFDHAKHFRFSSESMLNKHRSINIMMIRLLSELDWEPPMQFKWYVCVLAGGGMVVFFGRGGV
jgi:hypothetical protein